MSRHRTGRGRFRCVLLALCPAVVPAHAASPIEGDLFFSDLPIVASVSRLPQRQADAPTSVTVIDRATIRASGARELSDLFRLVPGFQTYARSDKPTRVSYHGITDHNEYSPRVQVLVDGRSLHSPLFRGGMNWGPVPVALEDIERIEVVRGSNTTSYGANAFLGVINIITVDPALVRGVSLSANNGNQGVRDYTLRAGGQLGASGNFRLTAQRLSDDGLDENSVPLIERNWQDRNRSDLLALRTHFQIDMANALELHLGHVEGRRLRGRWDKDSSGNPLPGVSDPGNPMRELEESSSWLQLRWLHTLSDTADFSLRYTYSVDEADDAYIDPSLPPDYAKVDELGDSGTRHELEAVHTFMPFSTTRLAWGGNWRQDRIRSETALRDIGTVNRHVGRLFVNTEWKPSDWFTGNLGTSYEHDSLAGDHIAPRGSLSFHITPENTVRLGYARAWRTGGTLDYRSRALAAPDTPVQIGNRKLPAERLDTWELAYLGDWHDWRMSVDVRHFRERVTDRHHDRIRVTPGTPYTVAAPENLRINGYEFQWKWQPLDGTRLAVGHASLRTSHRLNAYGRYLTSGIDSNYASALDRYVELAERSAPRRSTSLLLMQELPFGFNLSIARYWVGETKWTRNTEVRTYNRTDLRIAYPFKFGLQRGELAYTWQSLGGAHAEERDERVVDRRHWVSLRVDF